MDLTFQVPMRYCSLQHQTLLPPPATSTTGCCFCFGFISLFFLELLLHWCPVAYWKPTDLGSSSFSVLSFCPFVTVHGVLKAGMLKWFAIPFSSGPHFVRTFHHDLSVLRQTHGCIGMAHSYAELGKAVVHMIRLVSFLWMWFSVCLPSDGGGQEAYGSSLKGENSKER